MDKNHFGNQIDRLRRIYAPSALNDERVQIWWDRFKHASASRFEQALNHVIGEATTQALPSVSKISEALMLFQDRAGEGSSKMQEMQSPHACDACRDYGYGFVGDLVKQCSCETGRRTNPAEIARQQANYDRGKVFLKKGSYRSAFLGALPYDPNDRSEA
jgi:hypothetical protein